MTGYLLSIGIVVLIYAMLALGLNIQFGMTRLINFGIVGFFGIGAYGSGLLALHGWSLWFSIPSAGLLAALSALPIGLLSLRLRDDYLAIVTLAFSEAVRIVIQQDAGLTHGVQGLAGLPGFFPTLATVPGNAALFTTLLLIVSISTWGISRLGKSPLGRLLRAIGDDEPALAALGKNPAWFKVQIFMLGAGLFGIAGAFYAHFITFITPEQFIPLITFYVWMSIIIGGSGKLQGALGGTVLLMIFLEGSRFAKDLVGGVSEVQMASLRLAVVGLTLILVTLYRPQGLFVRAKS